MEAGKAEAKMAFCYFMFACYAGQKLHRQQSVFVNSQRLQIYFVVGYSISIASYAINKLINTVKFPCRLSGGFFNHRINY